MLRRTRVHLQGPWAMVFALAMIAVGATAPPASARPAGFSPTKFAAVVQDDDSGAVLYARNADAPRHPASLTKVMTLYLVFDDLEAGRLKLDDRVRMSRHAAAQAPSKLGLPAGESLSVRQAIDIVVVKSANDVAVALAERAGGSEGAFVRRMNAKARALGMSSTHFENASGLPNRRQVTTARDLARLSRAMLRDHPKDYAVFDKTRVRFRGRTIAGHNRLLTLDGVDGIKTGYTRAAGFNLITSGEKDGRRLVAVVMGGETARRRDAFMTGLLERSFARLETRDPVTRVAHAVQEGPADGEVVRASAPIGVPSDTQADSDPGGWRVQVGAFHSRAQAKQRLEDLRERYPRRFGSAPAEVDSGASLFIARFAVSSRDAAEARCELLQGAGEDCLWFSADD